MRDKNGVLIVGSYGMLVGELINKLNKEGWRIDTLIGDGSSAKPSRVFEQYAFDYGSDSVWEVMASCRPGTVLFVGAHDQLFRWSEKSRKTDAGRYISGLNNLLLSARESGVRHFVYVSSECVFGESDGLVSEDAPPSPPDFKGVLVAQGERLAQSFHAISGMEVTVVRLSDLYGVPGNAAECEGAVTRLCLEAVRTGAVDVSEKRLFAPLYAADAVHALFLLISAPSRAHAVYHVAGTEEVSEYDVARAIGEASGREISIADRSEGVTRRRVLCGEEIAAEFGFAARTRCDQAIAQIVAYLRGHLNQFGTSRDRVEAAAQRNRIRRGFSKLLPYLECAALFIPFYFLSDLAEGSAYLRGIDFFLIFVLLFALMRGRMMAVFAFALSVGGYCVQQARAQGATELLINAATYTWIAEAFALGLYTGYLRDRLTQMEKEKNEEIHFLSARLDDIAKINQSNTKIKNYFEEHVINSKESIGWFYEIISQLDSADSGEVMFIATRVLSSVMGSNDVALYAVSSNDLFRLTAATTPRARSLGKSIQMSQHGEIDRLLRDNKVYLNKAMDPGMPSMMSSLLDADGNMRILVLLWDMAYENMTLYYANMLKVTGALIMNAVIRSANYMDALAYRRYLPGTRVLRKDAFEEMRGIYRKESGNNLTEYCAIEIPQGDAPIEELSARLDGILRHTDIVGSLSEGKLGVLLVNTACEDALGVVGRLNDAGIAARRLSEEDA